MAILLNNQRVLGISIIFYLVGGFNPSEKYESQLGWLFPIYGKTKVILYPSPQVVPRGVLNLVNQVLQQRLGLRRPRLHGRLPQRLGMPRDAQAGRLNKEMGFSLGKHRKSYKKTMENHHIYPFLVGQFLNQLWITNITMEHHNF